MTILCGVDKVYNKRKPQFHDSIENSNLIRGKIKI